MSVTNAIRMPFPTRDDLLSRGTIEKYAIAEEYDLWVVAHEEAMDFADRLLDVFGNPSRPRITLHVAQGYDDEWNLSEGQIAELAALDPEQHWMDITKEATIQFQGYFCFSDPEGWRFYLPAFLRHYLADFPLSCWDSVLFACQSRTHFDLFTPPQVAFVDEFLSLCQKWDP